MIVGAGLYAADTDAEAHRLATSAQLQVLNLIRGAPQKLPPPVESMEEHWTPAEQAAIQSRMQYAAIGSAATIRRQLEKLVSDTAADEIMLVGQIYDQAARLRSYEIAAAVLQELAASLGSV